uniref:Deoxynucleotidyltransferase terminal interacting protein 2 n=1 Tax=Falco tinnunculus TaxID=100819 RepID=A0A8C4TUM5_FALTI
MVSNEISTPMSTGMTRRRTKSIRKPEVIQESQSEELEHTEAKSDVSDSLELQLTRNENTVVNSAPSVAEPQADGDVSETESNCSAVSGLQTPLFVRVTRRRQIVVPYQPDYPDKKRHDKTASLNKLSRTVDEDDASEAESCSSAVSGVQMPNVTRTTRSRQSRKKLQADRACEVQSEDISDAESCCLNSCMEPSGTSKRITRSMQVKSQADNTKQTEKGNKIVSEDENLIEDTIKSEPVIISDARPAAKLVSDTEDSPGKKAIKNRESVKVDDSEKACGQIQEHSEIFVREEELEDMDLSLADCMSPKQFLESQGQITPNKNKKLLECEREDAEAGAQKSFTYADKPRKGEQPRAVSSSQKDIAVVQSTDSIGGCRMFEIDTDSGEDQTGEHAESVFHNCESSSTGNSSLVLFLSKDDSDESENSGVLSVNTVEEELCYNEADERTPSLKKSLNGSLHAEGLFVIDTEPGMSSSQKYYLDQVDQDSDADSKHEGSEKGEESSDLEEAEEELIDEDEKDEDDDLLKTKIDVLHLSSSIDPGLNIKKLGGLYISFDAKKQKPESSVIKQLKEKKKDQLLQKSVITPDFEKKECVPPFRESLHQLKKQRRAEREKTTGDGWFGMKAPEITSELKNDLKVLKMRASLDPKHFYKKNDRDGLPKYFQVGTVVDSPIDFYHSRIPKKQRKRTIVEELLADSEFRRYNKKKYQEIMSEKAAFAAGKKNRKKRKFHN